MPEAGGRCKVKSNIPAEFSKPGQRLKLISA
jgi:hypothetical protein